MSHQIRSWSLHALRLKIEGSYFKCKTIYKITDFRERVEIAEKGKFVPPLPPFSCEL